LPLIIASGFGELDGADDVDTGGASSFLTAIVKLAMPTSSKTGWPVRAPISALHPAP
jgi:hypothetical protein